jgi:diphthine-ammonia ligase
LPFPGAEEEFKSVVSELKEQGIKGMVIGDIYLDEHKQWVERVCSEVGIPPLEPLWNLPAEDSEPVLKEGFWKHWFLDIKHFEEECRV